MGGYTATAVLSGLIGTTTSVAAAGVLRGAAWAARGLRVPARNALLADVVPAGAYGRAYGFERTMDNLGAIGGPLLALTLVSLVGVRTAILLSIIPGVLAAAAIGYAIRQAKLPRLGLAYLLFAMSGPVPVLLSVAFALAGVGIGCAETAEHAAVATIAPAELRGSAFGLLATVQAVGNVAASAVAGLLYTVASPMVAFGYLAAWMVIALAVLGWSARSASGLRSPT